VTATEILKGEHRVIEQVLDCLDRMTELALAEGRLDALSAGQALAFFETFADRCHHGKEEGQLFPALEARGLARQGGPTGVMRAEHEQGRAHLGRMAALVGPASQGELAAVTGFAIHARAYTGLMRQHIFKEDHCLFPMAAQFLREQDQRDLLAAFERVEHDDMRAGTHEEFLRLADELARRFCVPNAATAALHGPSCGCGHKVAGGARG
jgi:hemerythrin-like domain-containing protein